MRVLQMTPDQINALPPAERGSIMQLVRFVVAVVFALCLL